MAIVDFFIGHGELLTGATLKPPMGVFDIPPIPVIIGATRSLRAPGLEGEMVLVPDLGEASSSHSFPDRLRVNLPSSHPQYRGFVILWCSYSELIDQVQGLIINSYSRAPRGGSTSRGPE